MPLTIPMSQIHFVYDPAGRKDDRFGVQTHVCRLLNSARQSIVLETPYFVPAGQFDQALRGALRRHVRVIVLTNSLETTDHQVVYPAYRDRVQQYLNEGAEIWEYHGPDILHAKTIVVDQRIAAVTSFNFDPRSANLDTQTGIVIHDRYFADQVLRSAQPHFDSAVPVNLDPTQASATEPAGPLRSAACCCEPGSTQIGGAPHCLTRDRAASVADEQSLVRRSRSQIRRERIADERR